MTYGRNPLANMLAQRSWWRSAQSTGGSKSEPTTARPEYERVDIAIVAESTYPYLRGGVSAVIQDIVDANPDLSIGIIHITWDSNSPMTDLYSVPPNVRWVMPVYQSMQEHRDAFMAATPGDLRMSGAQRRALADRVVATLARLAADAPTAEDFEAIWQLYDEGLNPRTREYPLWALLGTREFMVSAQRIGLALGVSLSELFWLMREFFSLTYAICAEDFPAADVYHSHTTGYAGLLAAAAARQNGGRFLLTEHNLYTRDTVNLLLERSLALDLTREEWQDLSDISAAQRAWMAWFTEMGRLIYGAAAEITYLYPKAIGEAVALGGDADKSVVVANGIPLQRFEQARARRAARLAATPPGSPGVPWRLGCTVRVVPIKGVLDLLEATAMLRDMDGVPEFVLDIMGPTGGVRTITSSAWRGAVSWVSTTS